MFKTFKMIVSLGMVFASSKGEFRNMEVEITRLHEADKTNQQKVQAIYLDDRFTDFDMVIDIYPEMDLSTNTKYSIYYNTKTDKYKIVDNL